MNQIISKSPKESAKIAEKLLLKVDFDNTHKAIIFLLRGELGGGKTVFAKSIGKTLGVKKIITSPTFIIFNQYLAKFGNIEKFLHFDLYRIEDEVELEEINFFDQFTRDSVACVEWPEKISQKNLEKLSKNASIVNVWFEYRDKEKERKISFEIRN